MIIAKVTRCSTGAWGDKGSPTVRILLKGMGEKGSTSIVNI